MYACGKSSTYRGLSSTTSRVGCGYRALLGVLLAHALIQLAHADVVRVDNPFGGITIRVVPEMEVKVGGVGRSRPMQAGDLVVRQEEGLMVVECRPTDGADLDLVVNLPYGVEVEARTETGFLTLEGLIAKADLTTETGNIKLRVPWKDTKLEILAEQAPPGSKMTPAVDHRNGSSFTVSPGRTFRTGRSGFRRVHRARLRSWISRFRKTRG